MLFCLLYKKNISCSGEVSSVCLTYSKPRLDKPFFIHYGIKRLFSISHLLHYDLVQNVRSKAKIIIIIGSTKGKI